MIARLEPVISEMEREGESIVIVGHQAVLRVIFGYLMAQVGFRGLSAVVCFYCSALLQCVGGGESIVIVGHQALLRVIFGYLMAQVCGHGAVSGLMFLCTTFKAVCLLVIGWCHRVLCCLLLCYDGCRLVDRGLVVWGGGRKACHP
jgi:broad specificity phosphatase PhoE